MWFFKIILFVVFFNIILCKRECQNENVDYYSHLGTKSAYRFLANLNDTKVQVPGCKESRIWMIIRHGTRYPGKKKTKIMDDVLSKLRNEIISNFDKGSLCQQEKELFEKWKLYPSLVDDKNLAHEGEDEMIELAERMQKRFPSLFPEDYDNNTYSFRFTATQRCTESARHFTIGLFGRKVSRYVRFPDAIYKDPILRFYKLCDKWRISVKKNDSTYFEWEQFGESKYIKQVQENVSGRLGLDKLVPVGTLQLMYTVCGFETAWDFRQTSPWCMVFSENDFKIMEYLEDVKYYYVDGHGHRLNKDQACPVIKNMFNFFDSSEHKPTTTVYFTHSGTILKLLSHLRMYQDSYQLRHDNYADSDNRQWRVSKIDAFASNIAFVLYDCEDDQKLMVLHQEKQVYIPGCPEDDLCPLETLREVFSDSLFRCNFNEMCSLPVLDNKLEL